MVIDDGGSQVTSADAAPAADPVAPNADPGGDLSIAERAAIIQASSSRTPASPENPAAVAIPLPAEYRPPTPRLTRPEIGPDGLRIFPLV